MKVTSLNTGIVTVHDFLSAQECRALIAGSERRGYEAALIQREDGAVRMEEVRNNDRVIFDDPDLAGRLFERVRDVLPAQLDEWSLVGLNERFRFYRYVPGQYFRWHKDGFYERSRTEMSQLTLLLYLNEDFQGGGTEFRWLSVQPAAGMALVFPHLLRHQGAPVTAGVKYVLRTDVMYRRVFR